MPRRACDNSHWELSQMRRGRWQCTWWARAWGCRYAFATTPTGNCHKCASHRVSLGTGSGCHGAFVIAPTGSCHKCAWRRVSLGTGLGLPRRIYAVFTGSCHKSLGHATAFCDNSHLKKCHKRVVAGRCHGYGLDATSYVVVTTSGWKFRQINAAWPSGVIS